MDTWWKKLIYSNFLKALAVLGFCVVGFLLFISAVSYNIIPRESSVYETDTFREELIYKAGYVRDYIVRYMNDDIFTNVSEEEKERYIAASGEEINREQAKKSIIADRKQYAKQIQTELEGNNFNVEYYAINHKTGKYVTNVSEDKSEQDIIDELKSRELYIVGNGHHITERSKRMVYDSREEVRYGLSGIDYYTFIHDEYFSGDNFEGEEDYTIYAAVRDQLVPGDKLYVYAQRFNNTKSLYQVAYITFIIGVVAGILLLIYWCNCIGRKVGTETIIMNSFDRIPFEFQAIGWLLVITIWIRIMEGIIVGLGAYSWLPYVGNRVGLEAFAVGFINFLVIAFAVCLTLPIVSSIIKHLKNKSIKEYIGIVRFSKIFISKLTTEKHIMGAVFILLLINMIVSGLALGIGILFSSSYIYILGLAIWNGLLGIILYHLVSDYRTILSGTKAIANGELDKKIILNKSFPVLVDLADSINTIGTGIEKAVEQSVKSERLKAELITNVSHDLKTPLTSIISYIDLLKEEKIENERVKEYIDVLDERSVRLKHLVEDLVEASKAVTGNVEAKPEPFMLDELVLQAIGEYTDRIEAQGIKLIASKIEGVQVMADSRHIWRIVENLLSNVSKYAMPHTRAYVEVKAEEGWGVFTIKNISKDPLNIDPQELTERFVRGDESRTTEGSGLGLAIAQSLTDIQEGKMHISIDGDLFKVEISMPLVKESICLEK